MWSKSNDTWEISLCRKGHRFASAALFTTDNLSAVLGERVSAKVQLDKTGLCCILMTAGCFYHTALSSCILTMFSCCHAAVEMERFMRRCFSTARAKLRLVFEIEFFIVMQIGSDLTHVMLAFFFYFYLFSRLNIPHPNIQIQQKQWPDRGWWLWKTPGTASTCLIPHACARCINTMCFRKNLISPSALFPTAYSNVNCIYQTKCS